MTFKSAQSGHSRGDEANRCRVFLSNVLASKIGRILRILSLILSTLHNSHYKVVKLFPGSGACL